MENILASRSTESYWDPNQRICTEIMVYADWLGAEVEEEIERVRREESQRTG